MRIARFRLVLAALLAGAVIPPGAFAGKAGEVRVRSMTLLNQGVAAYKRGEHAEAVAKLQEATSMALNSFRAHYYLGLALIGDRRYDEAREALEIALELDPSHLLSHIAHGDALLKMGDLDEAQASYFRALKNRPGFAASLDGLARVYEAQGDDEKAIVHFRQAIQSNTGFAPAYTHLGDLYLRLGRIEEAVRLLEEAVTVRPDFTPGLNRLALAYGRLGLDNEAVATIQKALQLEPNHASHSATLGELQLGLGFVSEARLSFEKALERDPALPEALLGLAEVERRSGDYTAAKEQVGRALADARLDERTADRLRAFLTRIEAEEIEVAQLEISVGTGQAAPEDYGALAGIHAGRGQWAQAAELERLAGDPSPAARERLAYLLFRAGRYREAHELYDALAVESPSADLELNSGVSLARLGDDAGAVEAYRRALALAPEHVDARLYLANALMRLGDAAAAVQAYAEYLAQSRDGPNAERVRRILKQVAPDALPPPPATVVSPAVREET